MLEDSINLIYKSLFPDEKYNLEQFLNNYPNKFIKKPKWKFALTKSRNDDNIRKEMMEKNKAMRSYEYLRKPTKLSKIRIIKPRMVQIIEENINYKNRYLINPRDEEYISYKNNKNKSTNNIFNSKSANNFFENKKNFY